MSPMPWPTPVLVVVRTGLLLAVRTGLLSGPHQAGDRIGCLGKLPGCHVAALGSGLGDAVTEMVLQQAERHRLQRPRHRGHLGEDVDAVLVVLDHPLQAAHLALDPAQPYQIVILAGGVSVHSGLRSAPGTHGATRSRYYTPVGYIEAGSGQRFSRGIARLDRASAQLEHNGAGSRQRSG